MNGIKYTPLDMIYQRFFGKITDDLYLAWTKEDTINDLYNILVDAIPFFEFPRFDIYNHDDKEYFEELTSEEINIIAMLMYNTWLQRQVASIENIRMKYSGPDFKMTSQANHLDKLIKLRKEAERASFHAQRLYERRTTITSNNGSQRIKSVWGIFREDRSNNE